MARPDGSASAGDGSHASASGAAEASAVEGDAVVVLEAVVRNPHGMHLRPATEFARIALQSGCTVVVEMGESRANGASVLELALMAIGPGSRLCISVDGEDAAQVAERLAALLDGGAGV